MNQSVVQIVSETNSSKYCLALHAEAHIVGNRMMCYNSLFDTVVWLSFPNEEKAGLFIEGLTMGVEDIYEHIEKHSSLSPKDVYTLLAQKKIIE